MLRGLRAKDEIEWPIRSNLPLTEIFLGAGPTPRDKLGNLGVGLLPGFGSISYFDYYLLSMIDFQFDHSYLISLPPFLHLL